MSVSLYAHGDAKIEIGKYGMSLQEAEKSFIATCTTLGLEPKIKEKYGCIIFNFGTKLNPKLGDLLYAMADVADLHGDPPFTYSLCDQSTPNGEYIKTGCYND